MPIFFRELDVRPILKGGGEPFPVIMKAVQALTAGEGLRLLATFRPTPLFMVMAKRGFSAEERDIGNGDWEILFSPQEATTTVSVSIGAEEAAVWPDPLWSLDLRDVQPPGPMEKVLARIELMDPGEVLFAVFADEPAFLRPELDKRGHQWVGNHDQAGSSYRMLIRVGGGDE